MGSRVYDLRAWRRARRQHLVEEPLCRECARLGQLVPAKHVDHIVTIRNGGDWFDGANLQSLCASCHSFKTLEDKRSTGVSRGCDADGNPSDPRHPWNGRP